MASMATVVRHRGVPVEEWRTVQVPDGWKIELIGGEPVVTPAPTKGHAIIATLLAGALNHGDVPDGYLVVTSAVEWEIAIDETHLTGAPQPDLVVIQVGDAARLTTPPLLAAEVLSLSDRDRLPRSGLTRIEAKRLDYATGGLTDFLEVDRAGSDIVVRRYELHDGELRVADRAVGDETLSAVRPFKYTIRPTDLLP